MFSEIFPQKITGEKWQILFPISAKNPQKFSSLLLIFCCCFILDQAGQFGHFCQFFHIFNLFLHWGKAFWIGAPFELHHSWLTWLMFLHSLLEDEVTRCGILLLIKFAWKLNLWLALLCLKISKMSQSGCVSC